MSENETLATPLSEEAWLTQLELISGLAHPAATLVPSLVSTLRLRIDAAFGAFGWIDPASMRPRAFWLERVNEATLRNMAARAAELFDEYPLRMQVDSDGEAVRGFCSMPDYESSWHYLEVMVPSGMRWATGIPVRNAAGACSSLAYLYRNAAGGRFSDEEQNLLRKARDRMRALGSTADDATDTGPLHPNRIAVLELANDGRMLARGTHGFEFLYLCQDRPVRQIEWAASNEDALPDIARETLRRYRNDSALIAPITCVHHNAAGRFDFRFERMGRLDDRETSITVTILQWEPADLIVARELAHWSLAPQEKRIVTYTARGIDHKDIADQLGVTVGSLKVYVNRLLTKLNVDSREEIVDRVLQQAMARPSQLLPQ